MQGRQGLDLKQSRLVEEIKVETSRRENSREMLKRVELRTYHGGELMDIRTWKKEQLGESITEEKRGELTGSGQHQTTGWAGCSGTVIERNKICLLRELMGLLVSISL